MYKDRFLDKPLQKDILQESFINTMSAWVNMLLLSSTGPIKTPVGACATAVESVDIGYETIMEGKARICFVGGFDDFQEEGSYEFANMKATSNADDEFAHGRTPRRCRAPPPRPGAGSWSRRVRYAGHHELPGWLWTWVFPSTVSLVSPPPRRTRLVVPSLLPAKVCSPLLARTPASSPRPCWISSTVAARLISAGSRSSSGRRRSCCIFRRKSKL